jgi:hypothetical protein
MKIYEFKKGDIAKLSNNPERRELAGDDWMDERGCEIFRRLQCLPLTMTMVKHNYRPDECYSFDYSPYRNLLQGAIYDDLGNNLWLSKILFVPFNLNSIHCEEQKIIKEIGLK